MSDVNQPLEESYEETKAQLASSGTLIYQGSLNHLPVKNPPLINDHFSSISIATHEQVFDEMTSHRISMDKRPILEQNSTLSNDSVDMTGIAGDTNTRQVILLSSKSRGSDWDLPTLNGHTKEEPSINGIESEDSGFQLDLVDSSRSAIGEMSVTSATSGQANGSVDQVGSSVINITPPSRVEHRMLEHLHSTPLPLVGGTASTMSPESQAPQPSSAQLHRKSVPKEDKVSDASVKDLRQQVKPVIDMNLRNRDMNKGPDQLFPADSYVCTTATGAVKLKIDERGIGSIPPLSIPTLLQRTVSRHMDKPALCVKRDGQWVKWTYKQYLHDVQVCARAFIRLGLERFHSVCILGFNSPEWFIADLAAIHAGGFAAGIYTTNTAEACLHCALNSQANIIVVEDRKQLEKVLEIKDQIPSLKAIVQYTGKPHVEGVITWSQLMNLGNATPDNVYEDRLKKMAVNQCCTIIYTSGTTGPPKGVMLNHDNLTWISHVVATHLEVREGRDTFLSYLPMSHVAAQIIDLYCPLSIGGTVYFAQPDALKGSLGETLKEVRPTIFFGVPRVWEKIYEKMQAVGKSTRGLKLVIAKWAKKRGLQYNRRRMEGRNSKPFGFSVAEALVFKKVRQALGLENSWITLSGAAPMSNEVSEYFMSLNIPIMEAYGMSESTGPHCINSPKGFRINSAGKTLPGCITKIKNADKEGNGEILMGGRHIFMGYLNDPDQTAGALDSEGFLCTGDVGQVDKFGFVYITGRLKELLITAGGENVAPVLIEDNIKAELPCVSQALVVGDRRKFLAVLLTLKTEIDAETMEPLPALAQAARDWCREVGLLHAETVRDVMDAAERGRSFAGQSNPPSGFDLECVRFVQAVDNAIGRANQKAISNAQRIQKWAILPTDFSIPGGEMGPTMKVKRGVVVKKYADVIESFY